MIKLLLARHGNTFGPDDTPVWVGADQDMPLVPTGHTQAQTLGQSLKAAGVTPDRIIAGPLKRTVEYAEIVRSLIAGPAVEIDPRLREIDYGSWGGKTTEEIIESHGETAVRAWNDRGQWPDRADWQPDPSDLRRNLKLLVHDIQTSAAEDAVILLVSSNGILRFFLDLVPGEFARRARDTALKTATGAVSCLDRQGGLYQVAFWNEKPTDDLFKAPLTATPET
ncbi:MAG: histidine phosphatase family protein [Pseudomonadota bacterium]